MDNQKYVLLTLKEILSEQQSWPQDSSCDPALKKELKEIKAKPAQKEQIVEGLAKGN